MRTLLHNLAIRLRMARQGVKRMKDYPPEDFSLALGVWIEANNSFQAAKQIYFDSLEK